MKLNFQDIRHQLHVYVNVEFELCPVGGHNMNDWVERKKREIKGSIKKSLKNIKEYHCYNGRPWYPK